MRTYGARRTCDSPTHARAAPRATGTAGRASALLREQHDDPDRALADVGVRALRDADADVVGLGVAEQRAGVEGLELGGGGDHAGDAVVAAGERGGRALPAAAGLGQPRGARARRPPGSPAAVRPLPARLYMRPSASPCFFTAG